jgi:fucose permease
MKNTVETEYPGGLDRGQVVAWRNSLFLVFLLAGLAIASWAARLPAVRDALNIGVDQVGILIFGIAAGSIVGLVLSSHIIARLGAKRTITWGMVGAATGIAIAGAGITFGASYGVTFAGLAIFGFTAGISDVGINVSGAANERVLGRSIMPIFHAFFSFGTMLGAATGALAEFTQVPLVIHLGITAMVIVVGVLLAVPRLQSENLVAAGEEPVAHDDHSRTWRGRLSIWRDPRTLLIGLVVLGAAFAEGSANDWIAIAMVDGHGVDNATGALVLGVFLTAMTAGRLGGVFLLDRFGRVLVLRVSFVLAAVGLLVIIVVPDPVVATIGAVAWGLGSALGFPIGMSAAADDPRTAAARVSAVATIGYAAFLVGPPVIGLLGEHVGILGALLVVLVLCAVGAFAAGATREPGRRAAGVPVETA